MSYAVSTFKNLVNYSENMHNWRERMTHLELDQVFDPSPEVAKVLQSLESAETPQGFVSKRYGKKRYIEEMNAVLTSHQIPHMTLTSGVKYLTDKVGRNTVVKYNQDIISYAEVFGGEYSVTYDEEMEW